MEQGTAQQEIKGEKEAKSAPARGLDLERVRWRIQRGNNSLQGWDGPYLLADHSSFSSFSTHVSKHQSSLMCGCVCCVSNFTCKFTMRGNNNNPPGWRRHESQSRGHAYSSVTWSGSCRATKIERAEASPGSSAPNGHPQPFPAPENSQLQSTARPNPALREERPQALRNFPGCPGARGASAA